MGPLAHDQRAGAQFDVTSIFRRNCGASIVMYVTRWKRAISAMLKDYARCVHFESRGSPARVLHVAAGLVRARVKHGIGPINYSLFLFSSIPSPQWSNYVTDKQFFLYIFKKHVPDVINRLVDDKALFYQHCIKHGIATIPIICGIGQLPVDLPSETITRIEEFDQWNRVLESTQDDLFIKPIEGAHGDGAFAVERSGQRLVLGVDTADGSPRASYLYMQDRLKDKRALLVQPRVRAHHKLYEISSANGLPTVRVVTAFVGNEAQVIFAAARLSVGANVTDNFSKGSSGNLAVAIDIPTGALAEAWGSARSDWPVMQSIDFHPDTGRRIRGFVFPSWPEVIRLALQAQNSLPGLKTTGWDIAVTDEGVLLVEANCYYSVAFLQVAYQRGLKRELSRFYE